MSFSIEEWRPGSSSDLDQMAEVLLEAVHGGSSVSFVFPFSFEDARRFWSETVMPDVSNGGVRAYVARVDGQIVGTALLCLAMPPNQKHRASVAKMLVHPRARRQGIARALMVRVEQVAKEEGKTLLTLDTHSGSAAERLYESLGFVVMGVIPRFSKAVDSDELQDATFFYKELT
ncbi:MAG TPA: GNAT family N-acetyltransferase [Fimbriimonas sp.]|nr:GNAT family N-acetyltransferase [Fimbriimonas sp.]